jgi:hypothetical protein
LPGEASRWLATAASGLAGIPNSTTAARPTCANSRTAVIAPDLAHPIQQQIIESRRHVIESEPEIHQHTATIFQRFTQLVPPTVGPWKCMPDDEDRAAVRLTAAAEI